MTWQDLTLKQKIGVYKDARSVSNVDWFDVKKYFDSIIFRKTLETSDSLDDTLQNIEEK